MTNRDFLTECYNEWKKDPSEDFKCSFSPEKNNTFIQFCSMTIDDSERQFFHYEILCGDILSVEVAVHFETLSRSVNESRLQLLQGHLAQIESSVGQVHYKFGVIKNINAGLSFLVNGETTSAHGTVGLLRRLIGATWPILSQNLPLDRSFVR